MVKQLNKLVLASIGDKYKICNKSEAIINKWNYTEELDNDMSDKEFVHNRVGEINNNNKSLGAYKMVILDYKNSHNILVEFQDKHKAKVHTNYANFKNGKVKNPYHPTVYGVGYIGQGKYTSKSKCYNHWRNPFRRCYSTNKKDRETWKGHNGVEVEENMRCFQDFGIWSEENYYEVPGETMVLDKDLFAPISYMITETIRGDYKRENNYDLNTICYLPKSINTAIQESNNIDLFNDLECGVKKTKSNKYTCSLGTFDTEDEAFNAYNNYRVEKVRELANKYKEYLPTKIYDKLMEWHLTPNLFGERSVYTTVDENGNIIKKQRFILFSDSDNPNND